MRKAKYLILLTFIISSLMNAQEEDANLILSFPEESEIFFFQYPEGTHAKAIYKSQSEVTNKYPEQLLESIISATNQEWVNFNTLGGAEKASEKKQSHFDKIKSMNKNKNYFELAHKLTFDVGGVSTSIIKFFTHFQGTDVLSGAAVMQFVDGRWQKTSHPSLSTLSIMVMRMKSEVLEGVVLQNSDDPNIKAIAERVSTEAGLNLSLLEEEFGSWYSPEMDETKIELYKDPRTW